MSTLRRKFMANPWPHREMSSHCGFGLRTMEAFASDYSIEVTFKFTGEASFLYGRGTVENADMYYCYVSDEGKVSCGYGDETSNDIATLNANTWHTLRQELDAVYLDGVQIETFSIQDFEHDYEMYLFVRAGWEDLAYAGSASFTEGSAVITSVKIWDSDGILVAHWIPILGDDVVAGRQAIPRPMLISTKDSFVGMYDVIGDRISRTMACSDRYITVDGVTSQASGGAYLWAERPPLDPPIPQFAEHLELSNVTIDGDLVEVTHGTLNGMTERLEISNVTVSGELVSA